MYGRHYQGIVGRWWRWWWPRARRVLAASALLRAACYVVIGMLVALLFMGYMAVRMEGMPGEQRSFIWLAAAALGAVCGPVFGFLWEYDRRVEDGGE